MINIEFLCCDATYTFYNKEAFQLVRDHNDMLVSIRTNNTGTERVISCLTETSNDIGTFCTDYFNRVFDSSYLTFPYCRGKIHTLIKHLIIRLLHDGVFFLKGVGKVPIPNLDIRLGSTIWIEFIQVFQFAVYVRRMTYLDLSPITQPEADPHIFFWVVKMEYYFLHSNPSIAWYGFAISVPPT